jgi:uncharacterized protein with GYD domain
MRHRGMLVSSKGAVPGRSFVYRRVSIARFTAARARALALRRYYLAFGEYDGIVICEFPGNTAATACSMSAAATGGFSRFETMVLLTAKEAEAAMKHANKTKTGYKPPQPDAEVHVRFCASAAVKLRRATRPLCTPIGLHWRTGERPGSTDSVEKVGSRQFRVYTC